MFFSLLMVHFEKFKICHTKNPPPSFTKSVSIEVLKVLASVGIFHLLPNSQEFKQIFLLCQVHYQKILYIWRYIFHLQKDFFVKQGTSVVVPVAKLAVTLGTISKKIKTTSLYHWVLHQIKVLDIIFAPIPFAFYHLVVCIQPPLKGIHFWRKW